MHPMIKLGDCIRLVKLKVIIKNVERVQIFEIAFNKLENLDILLKNIKIFTWLFACLFLLFELNN